MNSELPNAGQPSFGLDALWAQRDGLVTYTPPELFLHHVKQMWRNIALSPVTSMVSIVTITVSLTLLAGFFLVIENVREALHRQQSELNVSAFLRDGASDNSIAALVDELRAIPGVAKVKTISKAQALADFSKALGDDAVVLEGLGKENPLPASMEVELSRRADAERLVAVVERALAADPIVERVSYNRVIAGQLSGVMRSFRFAGGFGIVVILVLTAFVIANTIKLALYAHRVEIEIMRLVGATDSFVRAPYLLEGFVGGVLGGVIALGVVYSLYSLGAEIASRSPILVEFLPSIAFLSMPAAMLLLVIGAAVGYFGSYAALRRFMRDETR